MNIWLILGILLSVFSVAGIRDSKIKLIIYTAFMLFVCGLFSYYSWDKIWWACIFILPVISLCLAMLSNFAVELFGVLTSTKKRYYNDIVSYIRQLTSARATNKELIQELSIHYQNAPSTHKPYIALCLSYAAYEFSHDLDSAAYWGRICVQSIGSQSPKDLIMGYHWIAENPELTRLIYE